jgi:hypothetical protein
MDDKKYPVYDYVKFIWNKKLWLILAAIICMIAGAAFSFTRTPNYTSNISIFTGNGENEMLSKPGFIESEYRDDLPENLSSSLNVKIVEPFNIALSLSGKNKNVVESELLNIAEKYKDDLTERFNDQKGVWVDYTKSLEDKVAITSDAIEMYTELASSKDVSEENLIHYKEILMKKEETLSRYMLDLQEANEELKLYEPPKRMDLTTTASSNNLLRNMLLGAVFGFQLMLVILIFWKYILNARRSESQE